MGLLFENNTFARLSAPLSISDTTLILATGEGAQFPVPGAEDYFFLTLVEIENGVEIDYEIVKVTQNVNDSLTIVRGQDGTVARLWPMDTRCSMRNNAQVFRDLGDPVATELEMQEGTSTDIKRMSPALVKEAIIENAPPAPITSVNALTGDVVITANDLGANPTIGTSSNLSATGSNVVSSLTLTNGVITNHSVRSLTATDIGAAPTANPIFTGRVAGSSVVLTDNTINCSLSNYFIRGQSSNHTYSFSNVPSGSYSCILEVIHSGGTITWPSSVRFPDNKAPALEIGKTHLFLFITRDSGATWRGTALTNYNS